MKSYNRSGYRPIVKITGLLIYPALAGSVNITECDSIPYEKMRHLFHRIIQNHFSLDDKLHWTFLVSKRRHSLEVAAQELVALTKYRDYKNTFFTYFFIFVLPHSSIFVTKNIMSKVIPLCKSLQIVHRYNN